MPGSATRRLVAGAAALLLVACGTGEEDRSGVEVRRATVDGDSVTVVESPRPAWDEGEGWTVEPPTLVTGAAYFDSVPAPVFAPDGSLADTLAFFRMEMYNPPRVQGASLPFGRVTRAAAGPEGVWMGDGTEAEATLVEPSGDPVRILRWGHEPPRVDARIDAWLERRLEGAGSEERRRDRRRIEQAPLPERVPAYSQLVVDAGGRLRAHAVGQDWILGRWRDELDVEHVVLVEIRKG